MSAEAVKISTDEGVLRIVIDTPDTKGSLSVPAVRRIIEVLEDASIDDSLRVVVITSTGPDFCAGADLVAANQGSAANRSEGEKPRTGSLQRRTAVQAHRLIALLLEIQLPVVAVVRGWAAGLGCQLALAADFTIAADDATFWEPFTSRGFSPDSGATWLVPRLVGIARAKDLLMLGHKVSGDEASQWGMIHRSVADAELDATGEALVAELATAATVALGLTKRCINTALEGGITGAMADEALALELSTRSADFREGLRAFSERRDPKFEGR